MCTQHYTAEFHPTFLMKQHFMHVGRSPGTIVTYGEMKILIMLLNRSVISPKVNVWCTLMENKVTGPFVF